MSKNETIQEYIDRDIVTFIEDVTNTKSFTETLSIKKLLEVEQSRLLITREGIATKMGKTPPKSKDFETLYFRFIGTFVMEQKIVDRIAISEHIAKMKGGAKVLEENLEKLGVRKAQGRAFGVKKAEGEASGISKVN